MKNKKFFMRDVSVIIATYNRVNDLKITLKSLSPFFEEDNYTNVHSLTIFGY